MLERNLKRPYWCKILLSRQKSEEFPNVCRVVVDRGTLIISSYKYVYVGSLGFSSIHSAEYFEDATYS